jgi:hypothetical protein
MDRMGWPRQSLAYRTASAMNFFIRRRLTTIITVGIVGIVGVVVRVRAVGSQPLDVCDEQNTRRRQSNCL